MELIERCPLIVRIALVVLAPAPDREALEGDLFETFFAQRRPGALGRALVEIVRSSGWLFALRVRRTSPRALAIAIGTLCGAASAVAIAETSKKYVLSQVPLRAGPEPSLLYVVAVVVIALFIGGLGGWLVASSDRGDRK